MNKKKKNFFLIYDYMHIGDTTPREREKKKTNTHTVVIIACDSEIKFFRMNVTSRLAGFFCRLKNSTVLDLIDHILWLLLLCCRCC